MYVSKIYTVNDIRESLKRWSNDYGLEFEYIGRTTLDDICTYEYVYTGSALNPEELLDLIRLCNENNTYHIVINEEV